ncbi:MAG: hypothetical protein J5584_00055 [Clostridia bacterium]|nr:hypothetical protein [Clostridia bacterium]
MSNIALRARRIACRDAGDCSFIRAFAHFKKGKSQKVAFKMSKRHSLNFQFTYNEKAFFGKALIASNYLKRYIND